MPRPRAGADDDAGAQPERGLRARARPAPEIRVLESGTRLATFAVRCAGGAAGDDRATSVPVTVWDPPAWLETLEPGDAGRSSSGRLRRRFFQRPGGVGSRVDVEAELDRPRPRPPPDRRRAARRPTPRSRRSSDSHERSPVANRVRGRRSIGRLTVDRQPRARTRSGSDEPSAHQTPTQRGEGRVTAETTTSARARAARRRRHPLRRRLRRRHAAHRRSLHRRQRRCSATTWRRCRTTRRRSARRRARSPACRRSRCTSPTTTSSRPATCRTCSWR